ncbi:MAG: C10 family peptidase [Tannerella sp.]|jgi:hypothetical protein|nr:C10 family peptidase [Tannerella sp.]
MKRFIFILVSGLLLFGCNNLNEISEVDTPAESGDVHFVTGATAQKIALNFNVPRKDSNLQTRSLSLAADKSIKNVLPYKDENAETVLHIINFDDDDGFVLVSADDRMEPVLAYSEEGYFDDDYDNMPYGLQLWLDECRETVQYLRENEEPQIDEITVLWNKLVEPASISIRGEQPSEPPCTDYELTIFQLLTTTWGQGTGYNSALNSIICNGSLVKPEAGCVPVAVAQILKYHQKPTSYNWSAMVNTFGTTETQLLIANIHTYINATSPITYACDGTGVNGNYNIANLFTNYFGYANAFQGTYSSQSVKAHIVAQRPVILMASESSGKGHVWVCDGVSEYQPCALGGHGTAGYITFHMNWGWDGQFDGWYMSHTPNGHNYSNNTKMVSIYS